MFLSIFLLPKFCLKKFDTTIFITILLNKKFKTLKKQVLNILFANYYINFITIDLLNMNYNDINNLFILI